MCDCKYWYKNEAGETVVNLSPQKNEKNYLLFFLRFFLDLYQSIASSAKTLRPMHHTAIATGSGANVQASLKHTGTSCCLEGILPPLFINNLIYVYILLQIMFNHISFNYISNIRNNYVGKINLGGNIFLEECYV